MFGNVDDMQELVLRGINPAIDGGWDYPVFVYENGVLNRVEMLTTKVVDEEDGGTRRLEINTVGKLEYDEADRLIAIHVTTHDIDGHELSYTSTYEYDEEGRYTKINVPFCASRDLYATETYMCSYDAYGRVLQESSVIIPPDEDYKTWPLSKSIIRNYYDENGLLIQRDSCGVALDGPTFSQTFYYYDEESNLVKREIYSIRYNWSDYRVARGYSYQEFSDVQSNLLKELLYPNAENGRQNADAWVNNDLLELSKWDHVNHDKSLISEFSYTYTETTIMYIDLTPED